MTVAALSPRRMQNAHGALVKKGRLVAGTARTAFSGFLMAELVRTGRFAPLLPEEGWRRFAEGVVGGDWFRVAGDKNPVTFPVLTRLVLSKNGGC